jgi:peptidoglycan/LPS O-acetylase OafA/YrhL
MKRITYLDGLRGLACMQVVLFHYLGAFWHGLWLGVFANGGCAVSLFFLMSGFVLTGAFEKNPRLIIQNLASRILRLLVPAVFSVILAAFICREFAPAAITATWSVFLNQLSFGLFAVSASADSINPPLWTMAIEIWGSVIVLCLVWIRHRSVPVYIMALIFCIFMLGLNELALFMLGHLCFLLLRNERIAKKLAANFWRFAGIPSAMFGVILCSMQPTRMLVSFCGFLRMPMHIEPQIQLGAVLIFAAIVLLPPVQRQLAQPLPRCLGRISFSVYLIHFPIMASIGNAAFLALHGIAHVPAGLTACAFGLTVTLAAAILFDRYIDQPAINAARRLKDLLARISRPESEAIIQPSVP